ncbi:UDP-N-acetylmuramoyl-tripeptide--D-alanyl-D-alanine ligase [Subsaximicrobium wynnwilliamsii]|uniref:UDP-N-acetylmuramoyl-tripeptide--D-alanyl-D-alanine ligase n=1 Tax=Subsaximicrobium wynnwilliamsii TaxID=291179 RepID=A0A5C6ZEW3_9FLAO|nr:UDP-N-acetylmuramoyl-tripeptide--D-alanyl-D-alanine ligase [Subsaximicrobium wynnwilliamsii]TXD82855.1 UDP-N-acetylmuramoyl-tripeptide--D-alanyl-D-alanine ligase [Subsaximicrobium wynnwilliamsii]TXD88577.1 UDP-N-acetylmuramoyl-tripeptide--D-alanyl-D-alanine ligase [Subsaximicrobium wynnwilliamsii]TXE02426.1 UDP-N-acetylmuramoyl-tripeptide--D-alanyl-D-alanine ligase [Subsaximicrobium wynnwilliamsii]
MTIDQIYTRFLSCSTVSTDTRTISENCMFFALKGENFNGNKFASEALKKGASFCIVDELEYAVDERYILTANVLNTLQQLATQHRKQLNTPIIALTGSNGKTTTKELINAVLSQKYNTIATKGNLNNHIGVPLTLLELTKDTEIGIVEMGANHQKEIEFLCTIALPDYGLITNFGKAHLEGFGGVEGVIKGKSELYVHLKQQHKTIFINETDTLQIKQAGDYDDIIKFGNDISLEHAPPYFNITFNTSEIKSKLTGIYNFNNICAAIAIGSHFGVPDEAIVSGIETYVPKNNRSQLIEKNNLNIILDAYNANPTSMLAALQNLQIQEHTRKIAILGDMFELGKEASQEHQAIVDFVGDLDVDSVIFVGRHFYKTNSNAAKIRFFETFEDLKSKVSELELDNALLLIKGSRGMALERVLDLV